MTNDRILKNAFILKLKAESKKFHKVLDKETRPTLMQCQDIIAKKYGYYNWHHLLKEISNNTADPGLKYCGVKLLTGDIVLDFLDDCCNNKIKYFDFTTDDFPIGTRGKFLFLTNTRLTDDDILLIIKTLGINFPPIEIDKEGVIQIDINGRRHRFLFCISRIVKNDNICISLWLKLVDKEILGLNKCITDKRLIDTIKNHSAQGLCIVAGQAQSGKTTLINSIVSDILNTKNKQKIISLENHTEYVYNSVKNDNIVFHTEIPSHVGSYGDGIISAMLSNPNVIVLDGVRDVDGIKSMIKASVCGHLVLSGLNAVSVVNLIKRLWMAFDVQDRVAYIRDFINCLNYIIVNLDIPAKNNDFIIINEYLCFDPAYKESIINIIDSNIDNQEKCILMITESMYNEIDKKGQSFYHSAQKLFNSGAISEEILMLVKASPKK